MKGSPHPPSTRASAGRLSHWLPSIGEFLLVVGLSVVTFWKSLGVPFLAGDYDWLSIGKYGQDEYTKALHEPHSLYRSAAGDLFRWVYGCFGDGNAFPYRFTLLTIHVVNTFLAGKLVARILGRPGSAWIAAAIFAVAPASGEVVHSIAAFIYPVVAFLLIVGLTLYDRCVETGKLVPWLLSMFCFGGAVSLREHAVAAFPLAFLLEWLRGNGLKAFLTRGPWIRLGPPILLGVGAGLLRGGDWLGRIPTSPDYQLTLPMGERLLVTLERLVLPPIPMDFRQYATLHKLIGLAFLAGIAFVIWTSPRGDRRRGTMLLLAVIVSLAPFLPVEGDHVRQRFAYFGTVFAAGLVAFVVSVAAERFSSRVALPIVLAILAGLLLEQQAEFERDYMMQSRESKARADAYLEASQLVTSDDDMAVFVGDRLPRLVNARSTLRVVTGLEREQLVLVKVRKSEDFGTEMLRLRVAAGVRGTMTIYFRGADGYKRLRVREMADVVMRAFEGEEGEMERPIFVLLPRPPNSGER